MRKGIRVVVLFLLSVLSTAVLGVVAALISAVSLAATALIVPGTGTPDANIVDSYMQNARSRYIAPFNASGPGQCTSDANCTLTGINYPASFFPLVIFPRWCVPGRCETWDTSVGDGVDGLYTALQNLSAEDGPAVLFGYSQGGAVVSNALRRLEGDPLLDKVSSVVLIGNAYNPDGGAFTRLGFLPHIPFLNITWGPATPVDTGKPMTGIGFEYDPVMYAPTFWGNGLALVNMVAAFQTVHGLYLTPNGNGPTDPIAYGYTEPELAAVLATPCPGPNCRVDTFGNKYYMIPAKSLPIMDLIMSVVPAPLDSIVKPLVDLTSPAAEVLINLGYDWSGDPGKTRWLSPLPFSPSTNFVQVGIDLVAAIGEGIENAFGGGSTMIAPPSDNNVSAFSVQGFDSEDATDVQESDADGDESVADGLSTDTTAGDNDGSTTDDATVDEDEATVDEDDATVDEDDATVGEDDATDEDATADEADETTDDNETDAEDTDNEQAAA